jgi:hypothetical protein
MGGGPQEPRDIRVALQQHAADALNTVGGDLAGSPRKFTNK